MMNVKGLKTGIPRPSKEQWEKYRYILSESQWEFLRIGAFPRCDSWEIVDGLVNVESHFIIRNDMLDNFNAHGFYDLRFGRIGGNFICDNLNLTTMEGCPRIVEGDFSVCFNKLTSMEFSPERVGGEYRIHNNKSLVSLSGLDYKSINGSFLTFATGLSSKGMNNIWAYMKEKKTIWEMAVSNLWDDFSDSDRSKLSYYITEEQRELFKSIKEYGIIK